MNGEGEIEEGWAQLRSSAKGGERGAHSYSWLSSPWLSLPALVDADLFLVLVSAHLLSPWSQLAVLALLLVAMVFLALPALVVVVHRWSLLSPRTSVLVPDLAVILERPQPPWGGV